MKNVTHFCHKEDVITHKLSDTKRRYVKRLKTNVVVQNVTPSFGPQSTSIKSLQEAVTALFYFLPLLASASKKMFGT